MEPTPKNMHYEIILEDRLSFMVIEYVRANQHANDNCWFKRGSRYAALDQAAEMWKELDIALNEAYPEFIGKAKTFYIVSTKCSKSQVGVMKVSRL